MAIVASDIKLKYSIKTGAAGNSTAANSADGYGNATTGSLGKYITTTEITSAALNNLFDDVTGTENAASDIEYRCIFIHNSHASLTYTSVYVWLTAGVAVSAAGLGIAIAVDGIAASPIAQAGAQADSVATESDAPSGESFGSPLTKGVGLSIGDIAAGYCRAIWVRRSAVAGAAYTNDTVTLSIEGDTAA